MEQYISQEFPDGASVEAALLRAKSGGAIDTALQNKASKETQDKVMATYTLTKNVTVDASNLESYLSSLPRLLTENLVINVSGTCTKKFVWISRFYGSGTLTIQAETLGNAVFNEVQFYDIRCNLILKRLEFHSSESITQNPQALLDITGCRDVSIEGCSFSDPYHTSDRWQITGVYVTRNGKAVIDGCTFKDLGVAVEAYKDSTISVTGGTYSNNSNGMYVFEGGIIMLSSNVSSTTLGGVANVKQGGLIVKSDGTLL